MRISYYRAIYLGLGTNNSRRVTDLKGTMDEEQIRSLIHPVLPQLFKIFEFA